MRALGRTRGPRIAIADGVWFNVGLGTEVTFDLYLAGAAGDTYTLQSSATASGGANLAVITEYYTGDGVGGLLTRNTQAAAATLITTAVTAQNYAQFGISTNSLPDGHKFVKVTSTGAGLVSVESNDLVIQRRPDRLPVVNA